MAMKRKLLLFSLFLSCAILFSLFTVFVQVTTLTLAYLPTDQLGRHQAIIHGVAGSPYQYRILSEYLVEWLIRAFTRVGVLEPVTVGFIVFRIIQNVAIFSLISLYYKKLGLDTYVTLIGLLLLAWAMTHSLENSDLAFNTYSDVIFYLAAALVVLYHRHAWIIPIVGLAALNRETSGLIPFMLISHSLYPKLGDASPQSKIVIAIIALGLYTIIFFGLRALFGERQLVLDHGHGPGLDYFIYNISRYITYVRLFGTLAILPFTAIFSFRWWPESLRAFFWAVVPIGLVIHPFMGVIAETRYFLVPLALIFIPGTLFGLAVRENDEQTS